jgi:hypothetical protein
LRAATVPAYLLVVATPHLINMSNPRVFFDITIGGNAAGRIVFEVRHRTIFFPLYTCNTGQGAVEEGRMVVVLEPPDVVRKEGIALDLVLRGSSS